jgi:hypothetical protein
MSIAAANLAGAIKGYAEDNEGRLPSKWGDLETYVNFKGLDGVLSRPFQGRFVLLSSPFETMMYLQGGQPQRGIVVSISAAPVREDRRATLGRYLIWQRPGNNVRRIWLDEERTTKMFAEAGRPLPTGPIIEQPPTKHFSAPPASPEAPVPASTPAAGGGNAAPLTSSPVEEAEPPEAKPEKGGGAMIAAWLAALLLAAALAARLWKKARRGPKE